MMTIKKIEKSMVLLLISALAFSMIPIHSATLIVTLFEDGFESGNTFAWNSTQINTGCSLTVQDTVVHDGSYAMEAITDTNLKYVFVRKDLPPVQTMAVQLWLSFSTVSSTNWQKQTYLHLRDSAGSIIVRALIEHQPSGDIWRVKNEITNTYYSGAYTTINMGQWYKVDLTVTRDVSGSITLKVNDVTQIDTTNENLGAGTLGRVYVGDYYSDYASTKYYDSVKVDEVTVTPEYTLSVYTEGSGSVTVDPLGPYDPDEVVTLTAVPNTGWIFAGWENDLAGTTNPTTVTMSSNKTVTAIFTDTVPITVTTSASSYNIGNTMVVRIRQGTGNGEVMIQINLGSTVKWADQRTLDSSGNLDYSLKIPSSWGTGTFTIRVKDVEGGTSASTTYAVLVPTPPITPPSGGGGGGGGGGGVVLPNPSFIASLSPKDAAALLDDFGSTDIAAVLSSITNNDHVANILEAFNPDLATSVLEKMPKQKAIGYLRLMNDESVLNLILGFDETNKDLLQSLIDDDFDRAAGLIEEAIKTKAEGLSDEARKEVLEKLAGAISALDKQSLLDLLVYIAKLPETPTTVAYMFDSMSLSTVLDVVSTWLMDARYLDARANLIAVLREVSTSLLGDIYIGITNAERMVLYPYLTIEQVAELPEIGEFQAINLAASPSEVEPDEQVTVSYTITNTGDKSDRYVVPLKINGVTVETDSGLLDSGASADVTHVFTRSQTGTYTVEVLGKTAAFQVIVVQPPPTPADLVVTNLQLVPEKIIQGETVSAFVTVKNDGELSGTKTFTLQVDSADAGSKQATLAGGDSITLLFEIVANYAPGAHVFKVESFTSTLTVQEIPQQFPWLTVITVAIILVVVGAYVIIRRTM
jgi:uncharacterized repeat protein (TIGR02543 family)